MSKAGYKQTEEHKRKISEALLGKKKNYKSEETRLSVLKNLKTNYWLGKKRNNPEYIEKIRKAHLGQVCWFRGKKRPEISGEKHPNWKGDSVGYVGIHIWVRKQKGKPKTCSHCGITNKKRKISWANIDHKYRRNLEDYTSLCYSCHRIYDYKNNLKIDNKIGSNQFNRNTLLCDYHK